MQSPKTAERKVIKESIPEELASTYRQFIVDLSRMVASERGARLRVLISGISSKTATAGTKRKADEGVDSDDLVDDGGAQNGTTLA